MIFSYPELRKFFNTISGLGSTQLFKEWQGEGVFLLRHDVDFDLELALKLAKIEAEEGVRATYFVLTGCRTYNVLHAESREMLQEIVSLGHEVGLHFDPTIYGDGNLQKAVEIESSILSFAAQAEVKSVSLHNPSVHGTFPLFDGYVNAYDPDLFSDKNYISDSCYSFRGKDPFEFVERVSQGMVQVLLHPMHYSEDGHGYVKTVTRTVARHIEGIHKDFSVNPTYCDEVGEDLLSLFKEKSG